MRPSVWRAVALMVLLLGSAVSVQAQTFTSGSSGEDGALNLTTPGVVSFFDPGAFNPPLDVDGDGVYHFTSVRIGSGVTVDMTRTVRGPVTWLVQGDVQIEGGIWLYGEASQVSRNALPGAGGYSGGLGALNTTPAEPGSGPGGGQAGTSSVANGNGGGAGHALPGGGFFPSSTDGIAYGNRFLLPLLGGSGGGGGAGGGSGGGAGGGALFIASSTKIVVNGTIHAAGGSGGVSFNGGGGGSGGSIRLTAPLITGGGTLTVAGGLHNTRSGAPGRIRLEAGQSSFTGSTEGVVIRTSPGLVTLPSQPIRIVSVDGVPIPATPAGAIMPPDVVINAPRPVTLALEGRGIPPGTPVTINLLLDPGGSQTVTSTPLAGTVELSTATATATFPHGVTRVLLEASFTP
jgi:hypothetical protein